MPVLQYRVPLTTPLISFFALTTFPLKKIIPKLCKNFLCRGLLVSSRPLKNFTKYSLKLIRNGGTNWTTENIGFFSFFTKKNRNYFFSSSPPLFGFGFFFLLLKTLKYPWNKWLHLQRFWYRFARFFLIWLQHLLFPFFNFIVPMHVLIVSVSHVVPVFCSVF